MKFVVGNSHGATGASVILVRKTSQLNLLTPLNTALAWYKTWGQYLRRYSALRTISSFFLPSGLHVIFLLCFPTKSVYPQPIFLMRASCPTHLNLFCNNVRIWNFTLCNFLRFLVSSPFLPSLLLKRVSLCQSVFSHNVLRAIKLNSSF